MITPLNFHSGANIYFASKLKSNKTQLNEVPARSFVKEVPAFNVLAYHIILNK